MFTTAVTLEHINLSPIPKWLRKAYLKQYIRKPIVGGRRDELRFFSETVTITDIDHGIRRNDDGASPEGAAGEISTRRIYRVVKPIRQTSRQS